MEKIDFIMTSRLLITVDIEIAYDRDINDQLKALEQLSTDLASTPATWFCTADAAEQFAVPLRKLALAGHTIGCHGNNHSETEDYRYMSPALIFNTLSDATNRIKNALGVIPQVFRGPRMTTSAMTQNILRDLGYKADFSVCAFRWDFFAANCFDRHWIVTGPTPYCPASNNPFRPASTVNPNDNFIVVPLSGMGLPFVLGSVFIFGECFMLQLAKAITKIANQTSAPIVYLFHSYDFTQIMNDLDNRPWHQLLYPKLAEERYRINQRFLKNLISDLGLKAISAQEFLKENSKIIQ